MAKLHFLVFTFLFLLSVSCNRSNVALFSSFIFFNCPYRNFCRFQSPFSKQCWNLICLRLIISLPQNYYTQWTYKVKFKLSHFFVKAPLKHLEFWRSCRIYLILINYHFCKSLGSLCYSRQENIINTSYSPMCWTKRMKPLWFIICFHTHKVFIQGSRWERLSTSFHQEVSKSFPSYHAINI